MSKNKDIKSKNQSSIANGEDSKKSKNGYMGNGNCCRARN